MLDVLFVTQAKGNKQADKRVKCPAVPVCVFHPEAVCSQPDRKQEKWSREMRDDQSDAQISTFTVARGDRPVKTKCDLIADMSPVCVWG